MQGRVVLPRDLDGAGSADAGPVELRPPGERIPRDVVADDAFQTRRHVRDVGRPVERGVVLPGGAAAQFPVAVEQGPGGAALVIQPVPGAGESVN